MWKSLNREKTTRPNTGPKRSNTMNSIGYKIYSLPFLVDHNVRAVVDLADNHAVHLFQHLNLQALHKINLLGK